MMAELAAAMNGGGADASLLERLRVAMQPGTFYGVFARHLFGKVGLRQL